MDSLKLLIPPFNLNAQSLFVNQNRCKYLFTVHLNLLSGLLSATLYSADLEENPGVQELVFKPSVCLSPVFNSQIWVGKVQTITMSKYDRF